MSLVWTLIASFLYIEVAIVLLFVLPVANPTRWQRFFKSRFLAMLSSQAQMYFYLLLGVLVLFLLEAIREMRKYSQPDPTSEEHFKIGMQHSMRLFRAQRNFYISGFAIFLSLVIRRLVTLISAQAQLIAQSEASMRQAQSATTAARSLLNQQREREDITEQKKSTAPAEESGSASTSSSGDDDDKQLKENKKLILELREKIAQLNGALISERRDKEAMASQSKNLITEFDRLSEEYSKLQKSLVVTSNDKSD